MPGMGIHFMRRGGIPASWGTSGAILSYLEYISLPFIDFLLEQDPREKCVSTGALGTVFGVTPVLALVVLCNGERGSCCGYTFSPRIPRCGQ